jgi:hypothetical protein
VISEAGYWKTTAESFQRWREQARRVAPNAETFMQLEMAARTAEPRQAARIERVLGLIEKRNTLLRDRMRRSNAALDAALVTVYGLTPIKRRRT